MAGRTSRVRLAVDVISTPLRHPFLLAAQIAVAQAASGGRIEVGLGSGSGLSPLDCLALGKPFPPLAERRHRLMRLCEVLPALWRGERVTDEALDVHDASLGPIGMPIEKDWKYDPAFQKASDRCTAEARSAP